VETRVETVTPKRRRRYLVVVELIDAAILPKSIRIPRGAQRGLKLSNFRIRS
jgi:hypothetical protein